jgi:hypothetical protein
METERNDGLGRASGSRPGFAGQTQSFRPGGQPDNSLISRGIFVGSYRLEFHLKKES